MDSKEPKQIDEDDLVDNMIVVPPKDGIEEGQVVKDVTEAIPGPHIQIAQIAVVWAAQMTA